MPPLHYPRKSPSPYVGSWHRALPQFFSKYPPFHPEQPHLATHSQAEAFTLTLSYGRAVLG